MKPRQFVNEFASWIGKEENSVLIYDRAISEAGLRKKSRGKYYPEITLKESLYILLAVLGALISKDADKAAKDISKFKIQVGQDEKALNVLKFILGSELSLEAMKVMTFIDVIELVCLRLANNEIPDATLIEVEVDNGSIGCISIDLGSDQRGQVFFTGARNIRGHSYSEIKRVNQYILKWIGQATIESRL